MEWERYFIMKESKSITEEREVDKMLKVKDKTQDIGDFIESFLRGKGIILASYHEHTDDCYTMGGKTYPTPQCSIRTEQPVPIHYNIEHLLAEYFNIDLKQVENEKRKILDDIREKNKHAG